MITMLAVMIGWVFFRSSDIAAASKMLFAMADIRLWHPDRTVLLEMLFTTLGLAVCVFMPNTKQIFRLPVEPPSRRGTTVSAKFEARTPYALFFRWRPSVSWALICGALLTAACIWMSETTRFLYFQF